ncbi:hypothetical protein E0493_04920 [Roseomonas sp. M0104]|uniref:Uncharacterized protein n=1 Tax=Teichococcus coralli TaxID=2545983 RepID=A0A845B7M0_9PROT|nr:hypothetical protein [Pseudoroseomonas coralli]MXP62695.1 hypothetical protein [Pseudoroseomonas coralli]
MVWLLLAVLLLLGFPAMLVIASLSFGLWLVWLVLALIWGVITFVLHDAPLALLVVGALYVGYRYGRKRQQEDGALHPR